MAEVKKIAQELARKEGLLVGQSSATVG